MRVRAVTASEAGLLASAVALRWARPDLTAALAEHVGGARTGDDRMWIAAAGWLVHGRAAIGDGRQTASDALAEIARRGTELLDDPAADRLRIEVATLAAGQCEPAVARLLIAPVLGADRPADLRADAFGVLARCVMEERPSAIGEATRRAEIAWGETSGPDADIAVAALALLSAAALRRSGHPDSAVDRAAEGLARLDEIRAAHDSTPSRHLAAALAAEWITALIEAGRTDDAREGCVPMAQQLRETARPTRQVALLRLVVARALADSTSAAAVEALEQAAQDAADCDTPALEGLCLSTLGALREQSGRLDAALESMRRGVAAQRRDRARSERFRAALRAMPLGSPVTRTEAGVVPPERAVTNLARPHVPTNATADKENFVEPVHPLAGAYGADPWSSGRWIGQPAAGAVHGGGRRRRASRTTVLPEDLAAKDACVSVGAADGMCPAGLGRAPLGATDADVSPVSSPERATPRLEPNSADRTYPGADGVGAMGVADSGSAGLVAGALDLDGAVVGTADSSRDVQDADVVRGAGARVGPPDSMHEVVHQAPDPLFGPVEYPAATGLDESVAPGGSPQTAGVEAVASQLDSGDLCWGPVPNGGGIADIPVAHEQRSASTTYSGDGWLEAALAELDRVWGQPLPDLDGPVGRSAEPTAAVGPVVAGPGVGGPVLGAPATGRATGKGRAATTAAAAGSAADVRAADVRAADGLALDPHAAGRDAGVGWAAIRPADGPAADSAGVDAALSGPAPLSPLAGHRAVDDPVRRGLAQSPPAASSDHPASDHPAIGDSASSDSASSDSAGDHPAGDHPASADSAGGDPSGDPASGDSADGDPSRDHRACNHSAVDRPVGDRQLGNTLGRVGRAGDPSVAGAVGRAAVGPVAVGCVVVVDVVRAGEPVSEVGDLLREVGDRLTQRIPAGARLRFEADESALSVVLPGRERSVATAWMHQTLPALFADMADLGVLPRWAMGTALRAAVHDTDGPVGAHLLQRLDVVAPRTPVRRARHDAAPPAVIRWGVPILAGSGGRRRRPDDEASPDHPVERPDADERGLDQPRGAQHRAGWAGIDQPGAVDRVIGDRAGVGAPAVGEGRQRSGRSHWDRGGDRRQVVEHADGGASSTAGRHRGERPKPEVARAGEEPAEAGRAGVARADDHAVRERAEGNRAAEDGRAAGQRAMDERAAEGGPAAGQRAMDERAAEGGRAAGQRAMHERPVDERPVDERFASGERAENERAAAGQRAAVDERALGMQAEAGQAATGAAGPVPGSAEPGSAEPQAQAVGPVAAEESTFSVEGLGLADLLAGALAAYRGI